MSSAHTLVKGGAKQPKRQLPDERGGICVQV
jgi:hypothetical protein